MEVVWKLEKSHLYISQKKQLTFGFLLLLFVLTSIASVGAGSVNISAEQTHAILGTAMQGLFRNPLAALALIGIPSGATFAAVSVIVLEASVLQGFSQWMGLYSLPVSAFIGGFITLPVLRDVLILHPF